MGMNEHAKTIAFLVEILKAKKIVPLGKDIKVSYFKSGGGTHLYLIRTKGRKYLARVNFYSRKNDWGIKEQEYRILKKIEPLKIAPKVYYLSKKNPLGQHFTVVEYVEGRPLRKVKEAHVISLAKTLKKLHSFASFRRTGNSFPPRDLLPYKCDVFDVYASGEDKQIERYLDLPGIEKVTGPFNRIRSRLRHFFGDLTCFEGLRRFCIVHADLKKENILDQGNKAFLVDWECGGVDIPETDIGNLFAGCRLSRLHQRLFLRVYYGATPDPMALERIYAIKKVLDFFAIMEDYLLLKRKKWDADRMLADLMMFEVRL